MLRQRHGGGDTYYDRAPGGPGSATIWLAVLPVLVLGVVGVGVSRTLITGTSAKRTPEPVAADESAAAGALPRSTRPRTTSPAPAPTASPTTRANPPATPDTPAMPGPSVTPAASTAPTTVAAPPTTSSESEGSGCSAAVAWLSGHAAPGFRFECPGDALGHQGMTCVNVAGVCPGQRIIAIADACPAAYMNEAHNSWILTGLATGRLDPYGYCS